MSRIARVEEHDLPELLELVDAYLAFYDTSAERADLEALCRALLGDPEREGVQLIARDEDGTAVGFATVYWTWTTTGVGRQATMNDLFVAPAARGTGLADALIDACLDLAREHGAVRLQWVTGPDNGRAQAVYDRVGGRASSWIVYELPAGD